MFTRLFALQEPEAYLASRAALKEIDAENKSLGIIPPEERRRQLLDAAGFPSSETPEKDPKLVAAEACYPFWSDVERRLWKKYLPNISGFKKYAGPQPTDESLEAIQSARSLGCFDILKVMTDGQQSLAYGVMGTKGRSVRLFPIAQWGSKLSTYEQFRRRKRRPRVLLGAATFLAVCGLVALIVFASMGWFGSGSSNDTLASSTPTTAPASTSAVGISKSATANRHDESAPVTRQAEESVTSQKATNTADSSKPGYTQSSQNSISTIMLDMTWYLIGKLWPFMLGFFIIVMLVMSAFGRRW